jgi:hypothetical protein
MSVDIRPLPAWARKTRYKPLPPPVFVGEPTRADVELALALFAELDAESQDWYGGASFASRLMQRL